MKTYRYATPAGAEAMERRFANKAKSTSTQLVECFYHHWAVPAPDGSCPVCGVFSADSADSYESND